MFNRRPYTEFLTVPVFIERLWRSLKYEDVYIKGYADGTELRAGVAQWMAFYNNHRPHQALSNRAPMEVWREAMIGALPPMAVDRSCPLWWCRRPLISLPT